MAGDWIKWTKGLSRRREVAVIARKLNISRREAACACMEMWEWADDETADGHIPGATRDDLDSIIGLPGFADVMASREVDWVRISERGISLPRWDINNGETAKKRLLEARKKKRQRDLGGKNASRKQRDKCPLENGTPEKRPEKRPETREDSGLNSQSPERSRPTTGPPSVSSSGGSGRLKKPFEGDLDEATLRDEGCFAKWVARERRQRHGLIKSDDAERLAWAAREKALADKTLATPVGWLKDTLRHGAWDRVRQAHEAAGRETEREAASDGGAALVAAGVAPALKDLPVDPAVAEQRLRLRHQAEALAKLERERA